jgi:serine/threonine protein kinase
VDRTFRERATFAAGHAPCVGDRVGSRFRLLALGGAGAAGIVFRAEDLHEGGTVAVKVTQPARPSRKDRTFHEARVLAAVRHDAVVGYIAHGHTEQGSPYLAMKWIEGETLTDRLAREGLTPLESLRLAVRLSGGLAALHARGIVHRDLKPGNILLPGGRVDRACIVDLGVSRDLRVPSGRTGHGEYIGTPRYMSPEQIRDPQSVQGPSDVFALGCILHECLCGVPAFDEGEVFAVLAQILFAQPAQASQIRPVLPTELDQLLARMLSGRPERRPDAGVRLNVKLRAAMALPGITELEPPARAARDAHTELTADSALWSGDALAAG